MRDRLGGSGDSMRYRALPDMFHRVFRDFPDYGKRLFRSMLFRDWKEKISFKGVLHISSLLFPASRS